MKATFRAPAASRCGKTSCSPTCPTAGSSPSTATAARSSGTTRSPRPTNSARRESSSRRRSPSKARCWSPTARATRHPRLDRRARCQHRQRAVALVRGAEARRSGQRNLEGQDQRLEDRRRRHMADRFLRSGIAADHLGHRQSGSAIRSAVAPGRQSLHRFAWWRSTSIPANWSGTTSTRRTIPGTMTRSASTCSTTPMINGETRKVIGHFARNGFFYSLDRNNGSFIKGAQYVNDLNWTKGLDPKTGKPVEYDPELDVQTLCAGSAGAARRPDEAHLPDLARRRRAPADGLQSGQAHRLRGRHRRLLRAERRRIPPSNRPNGGLDRQGQRKTHLHQRSLLRRHHRVRHHEPQGGGEGRDRHRNSLGRDRHGGRRGVHRAAGRLGGRL